LYNSMFAVDSNSHFKYKNSQMYNFFWDSHSIAGCNSTNRHKYYGVECQPTFGCKIQEWLTGFREHNFMPYWGQISKFWM